ncbi:Transporter, major facilitator family protein [Aphelenchoides fujianensis]|nr:Transporter, major facilitator family protein [Aphelenchoides fujianensis]
MEPKRLWAAVGMEPALCLYMISSFVRWPVFQSLLYEKACIDRYEGGNSTIDCSNVSALHKDVELHEYFNHLYLVSSLCLLVPSMFVAAVLGSLCDSWSFKIPMLVPLFGVVLSSLNYVLQAAMMHWSPYWLVVSDLVFGLCGGYISITSTIFSYSMRTTDFRHRSERVAALEGAIGVGSALGSVASGLVRGAFGYVTAFVLVTVLNVLAFSYVLLFAREIRAEASSGPVESGGRVQSIVRGLGRRFKDVWLVLSVDRDPLLRRLTILTFVALAVELFSFSGVSDILFSFLRGRLGWTDKQYGLFNGLANGLGCINILLVYPTFRKLLHFANSSLAIFGITTKITFLLMLTLTHVDWIAYVAAIPMSFNRFVATGLRAMIGQFVYDTEQGRAFSLIALVECLSAIAATTIFNGIYPKTLAFFDGTMFVATAAAITIPLIILIFIHAPARRLQNSRLCRTESSSPTPQHERELYKKFKPALALSDSLSLEEWTNALPTDQEKDEMTQLIAKLYPMKNFSGVDNAMFKRLFPTLSKSINLTVIDNLYCVIHEPFQETPGFTFPRFFGFAVLAAESAVRTRLHHSAAHFQTDGPVCLQAAAFFGATGAKSLVVAGASRWAVKGKHMSGCQSKEAIADASHNTDLMFHVWNVALWKAAVGNRSADDVEDHFIQWHGMAEKSCPNSDAFISCGVRGNHSVYDDESALANKLKSAVNSIAGADFAQTPRTDPKCSLRATTNVFGRVINGVPVGEECEQNAASADVRGRFLHIEQKSKARRNLALWENAFEAITSGVGKNGDNGRNSTATRLFAALFSTVLTAGGLLLLV